MIKRDFIDFVYNKIDREDGYENDKKKNYSDKNRFDDAFDERVRFTRAGSAGADAHRRIPLRQLSL